MKVSSKRTDMKDRVLTAEIKKYIKSQVISVANSLINKITDQVLDRKIREHLYERDHPNLKIFLLPGGIMPVRKTTEAEGFDAGLRAEVSPFHMDPENK